MTLASGTRLGQYEIVDSIGAGGMGEVYRARDTKLGREVAVKVLPEQLSRDRERLARFEREAKLLAALNHPAIAHLYGFEEEGGTIFLIMELVEGETLAERIARGPVPVDEALPLLIQIAEGLEAAHEKGIIHRDLKPANAKITPDGHIKILDFGLAKAFSPEQDVSAEMSQSPTLTKGTALGAIMGTAAYMSPEQAKGNVVDRRADIWAFGCVAFEVLTGRRTFRGDDVSETLASVLRDEPRWEELSDSLPWRVRELLEACLQKNARERVRDIGDARLQIEKALREPGTQAQTAVDAPSIWRQALPWILAAAGFVTAIAGFLSSRTDPRTLPVARLAIPLSSEAPIATDSIRASVAISPDGQQLVYVANREGQWHLFSRELDEPDAVLLPGTEGANNPFFSPDGRWVGFFAGLLLKKVSLAGGAPVSIATVPPVNRGASWGPDETIYFTASPNGGLATISANPENAGVMQRNKFVVPDNAKGEFSYRWPNVLPNGKGVLFTLDTGEGFDNARISVLEIETGQIKTLIDGGTHARYVHSGHVVFARHGSLWAAPFDEDRLEVLGEAVTVVTGVATEPEGTAHFSASENGTLAFVPGGLWESNRRLVWVDREGFVEPLTTPNRPYLQPTLSPDGRWIAITIQDGSNFDIWLSEVARGTLTRMTFDPGEDFNTVWSPDGGRIVFSSETGSSETDTRGPSLHAAAADGSGVPEILIDTERGGVEFPGSFHPADNILGFTFWNQNASIQSYRGTEIRLASLDDHEERPLLETTFNEHSPMFSPDGRWFAYVSDETGSDEVYLRPYPGEGGKRSVSTDGGAEPVWAPNGRELFYRNGDKMMAVSIETDPELSIESPELLFEGRFAVTHRPDTPRNYDVSRDGQHFLMVQTVDDPAPTQINIVLNWFEELERLVPTEN